MSAAKAVRQAASAAADAGTVVKGFKLLRLPMAAGSPVSRSLLVKRHEGRSAEEQAANGRTLFVTHLDNFVTEAQLTRSFAAAFGAVERVELKSVEKRAPKAELRADNVHFYVNFARVIFCEEDSLQKALAASSGRIVGSAVLPLPPSELKEQLKITKSFYRDPVELKREVDAWMAQHDKREEEKKRLARESMVDEDGFTKVISGLTKTSEGFSIRSASRPGLKTGAFAEPIAGKSDLNPAPGVKKKKNKEMPDFYRFQMREQKRQEIIDHRKRQVEDVEKVYRLKKKQKIRTEAAL
jgi:ribosomal RNA-processing protein 7